LLDIGHMQNIMMPRKSVKALHVSQKGRTSVEKAMAVRIVRELEVCVGLRHS